MKNKILILLLIYSTVIFSGCKDDKDKSDSTVLDVYCNVQQKGDGGNGVTVCSQRGVNQELVDSADEAIKKLSRDVDRRQYTRGRLSSDYLIFVIDNCVDRSGTRAFLIDGGAAYDGTIYDQDGVAGNRRSKVYAAEMVVTRSNNTLTNQYVVCYTPTVDEQFKQAARFGPEHIILYWNDTEEFERTKYHNNGTGHPIIPGSDEFLSATKLRNPIHYGSVKINR